VRAQLVLVEACPESQCPSEALVEVGHGGGHVYFECELGHDVTLNLSEVLNDLRSE
jgi:hypothetical protein